MIGLEDIKNKIIHQVLFYLQGLDESNKDMLHTVIEGDPGVGKTEIAKILGEIYCSLGILTKGTFTSVKRADLVGSYLGQTASKTLKVLEASRGGVLFIDEAYSLGNDEGKDIYSKECIDTITAYLSENRENFVCVIAGYKDALKKCFFKHNAGLERRFPWRYSIKGYSEAELKQIFEKIVTEHEWKTEITLKFFEEHMDKFKNYGGDMENLFHKSKLAHSMRALSLEPSLKKNITMEDINQGLKLFIEEEEEKEKKTSAWMMYT
jgi:AAA+ superfamily predicted ATPase